MPAFEIDGHNFHNLTLRDCDQVFVFRADLVILLEWREVLEAIGGTAKQTNPTERASMLHMVRALAREAYPDLFSKL